MRKGKGLTLFGALLYILLIGFFALTVLRLAPEYLDYYGVKDSMNSLAQEANIKDLSESRIDEMFLRRLSVNNIKNIDPKNLKVEKKDNGMWLSLEYETRVHFISNIDVILHFQHRVKVE